MNTNSWECKNLIEYCLRQDLAYLIEPNVTYTWRSCHMIYICITFHQWQLFAVTSRLRFLWPGKLLVYIHSGISSDGFRPDCVVSVVITLIWNTIHVKSSLWSVNENILRYEMKYDNNKLVKIYITNADYG